MTAQALFDLAGMLVMPAWLLLILLPFWRGIADRVATILVPGLIAIAYTALIMAGWSGAAGGFGSMAELRALFSSDLMLVAGRLHYLAFDLFVGAWIVREARAAGIPHLVIVPLLPLTLMFGPAGYLTFIALRAVWRASGDGRLRAPAWLGWFQPLDRVLLATGLLFWLAMLPTGLAAVLDNRMIDGVGVWAKPLKFQAALGLFALTLAVFMPLAGDAFRRSWAGRFVVWGFVPPALFEIVYIVWRAARGEMSHFNVATPFDAALYQMMGIGAIMLTATAPVLAYGVARSRVPIAPAVRLAVVLDLGLTFVLGAGSGQTMGALLSHAVGVPASGDTGLPVFGWLRTAGDWRVAHFLGVHAQQLVPLAGILAALMLPSRAVAAVWILAGAYAALTLALYLQAAAGLPLLPL